MERILVVGGGPAGAAAAIAAAAEGASVRVMERSRQPRHKVCGEFLSPEVSDVLDQLGAGDFPGLKPATIRKCRLHFGLRRKEWTLHEPACGLSRFELDRILLERAAASGAAICRGESGGNGSDDDAATVDALGRKAVASGRDRLFGFKAHFEGPPDDAIELFFGPQGYVGVNPIENGRTNVCGMAPEPVLRRYGFDIDEYVAAFPPLARRMGPLRRRMEWLMVGPLCLSPVAHTISNDRIYPAGDALGFVDPFTGSGILNALLTGRMAGRNAARGVPVRDHLRECRALLDRPFGFSAIFRKLLQWNCAWRLAALTPGPWLFRVTRAQLQQ